MTNFFGPSPSRREFLATAAAAVAAPASKDDADLPPHQVRTQPADLPIHVGETYDFRWAPERPGEYVLRITTTFDRGVLAFPRDAPPPHVAEIPVRVR